MNCPECSVVMEEDDRIVVTFDRCPECDGVWFDQGEIRRYVEDAFRGLLVDAPDNLDFDGSTGVVCGRCPRCRNGDLTVTASRGLVHQRCASCGGFFLTRDHIDTILRQTRAASIKNPDSGGIRGGDVVMAADALLVLIDLLS